MSSALFIHGPIPHPSSWCISPDAESPPGFMRMLGATIAPTPRETGKNPGKNLVPREDINALPSQLERLLQAFQRCDAAARAEIVKLAEVMAEAAA